MNYKAYKYKQLRYLDESKIQEQIRKNKGAQPQPKIFSTKPFKTQQKNNNFNFVKNNKSSKLSPSDFLELAKRSDDETDIQERRANRTFSMSYSQPRQEQNFEKGKQNEKQKQFDGFVQQYKLRLQTKETGKLKGEQKQLQKISNLIAHILTQEYKRQIENIAQLKQKIQSVFNIKIIDHQSLAHKNNPYQFQGSTKASTILKEQREISFDAVEKQYKSGLLPKCGYALNERADFDKMYKAKIYNEMQSAFERREKFDKIINMGQTFPNHSSRLSAVQLLSRLSLKIKENRSLSDDHENLGEQFNRRQIVIWILTQSINSWAQKISKPMTLLLQDLKEENLQKLNKVPYIRCRLCMTKYFVHYMVLLERYNYNEKQSKWVREQFWTKPGSQNLQSVFLVYLQILMTKFGKKALESQEFKRIAKEIFT